MQKDEELLTCCEKELKVSQKKPCCELLVLLRLPTLSVQIKLVFHTTKQFRKTLGKKTDKYSISTKIV